ncbi:MAG: hypothetical protein HYX50_01110 [Chloroflexi bacterium]|nr:hypothetical protein [Chloroflexota bacterium]
MHLIWRRYSRSGAAPPWFYVAMAVGYGALAAWGIRERDWLVVILAVVMVAVTYGGARLMRVVARANRSAGETAAAPDRREGREHE